MRIGIAGAGLLGRLAAHDLAKAGHQVRVFESGPEQTLPLSPRAAAHTSAGMLSPIAEMESGGREVYALGQRSMAFWQVLEAESEAGLGLQLHDSLMVYDPANAGWAQRVTRLLQPEDQQPVPLSAGQPHEIEPELHPKLAGMRLPGEGSLMPSQALQTLQTESQAQFHWACPVQDLAPHSLTLVTGARHGFDWVIDCRGLGARPDLPIRGVRGETVLLMPPTGFTLGRAVRLLHPRWRVYLLPRSSGQLLLGASEIESEDRSAVSVESLQDLLTAATLALPALREARVLALDSNLRPALPNNLPEVRCEPGLLRINGLFRHGWLLAPALLADAFAQAEIPAHRLTHLTTA